MLAGGGTGGHLFPGIAVAEEARRRDPAVEVLFVGAERGIESRALPASGFAFEVLPIVPLRGRGLAGKIAAVGAFAAALRRARAIVARFAPDAVIGLGGYASAPGVVAARLARRPVLLLEQNARPGLTTRCLARLADRVCVSFPETAAHFRAGRAVVTGNPVRWQTEAAGGARRPIGAREADRSGFTILVFGGSAGARRLNQAAPAMCAALGDMKDLRVIHQTGTSDEETVRRAYAALGTNVEVSAFITDMGRAYAAVDLVICRAGATTVAELAGLGKPAILVPYPHAADDHQTANAKSLVRAGAARMVRDAEASGERLAAEVRALRSAPQTLAEMARRVGQFARPDAAGRVLETMAGVLRQRMKGH